MPCWIFQLGYEVRIKQLYEKTKKKEENSMSDFVIYYRYRKDPEAKVLNISIRAASHDEAVDLFYKKYPKENYSVVNPE